MPVHCKLTPLQRAASLPAVCRYRLSEFPEFKRHDSFSHLKPTGCLTLRGYKGTNSSIFHVLRHPETLYFKLMISVYSGGSQIHVISFLSYLSCMSMSLDIPFLSLPRVLSVPLSSNTAGKKGFLEDNFSYPRLKVGVVYVILLCVPSFYFIFLTHFSLKLGGKKPLLQ